jgi:hypothetical protein
MGKQKQGDWLLQIAMVLFTIVILIGCSSGGSSDDGDPPRESDTMTVVVETNQDEASFVITDAQGTSHAGGGRTYSDTMSVGSASIAFHYIDGYCTPGLQTLTGSQGDTLKFTANYDLGCSANLIVKSNLETAKFMLFGPENIYRGQGKEWQIHGIPVGQYTIRFDEVDDACYLPPQMQTITIVAGSTEEQSFSYTLDDTCVGGAYLFEDQDNDGYSDGSRLPADSSEDLSDYKPPSELISTAGDCDDADPFENPGSSGQFCTDTTWYLDGDGDKYSNSTAQVADARPDVDYYLASDLISTFGDCDDEDATIHPGVDEICNDGVDNNCDNLTDCADPACECPSTCIDDDEDGFYDSEGCGTAVDCDDQDETVHPGAGEDCSDNIDNDCDGKTDSADADCADADGQTIFSEDFEGGWGNWFADNGVWEVGAPTSGPNAAYSGSSVGATVLAGDYPNTTSSLVSPTIELPVLGTAEEIHLRFWQWFSFGSYDRGDVLVSQQTEPGIWSEWTTLTTYSGSSGVWSNAMVDLSAYAGSIVRIGFQLRQGSSSYVGPGWYMDDVSIETRPITMLDTNDRYSFDFDQGMGDWSAHNGAWEVGAPTSGPDAAHSGSSVGGTVLAGDYPNTSSSLVSPTIELPAIGTAEEIHLRFWQWFSFGSYDRGDVLVSQQIGPGIWSDWTTLTTYNGSSGVWSNAMVDLSAYAGGNVRIGFQLRQGSSSYVGPGWYVDDVLFEVD